MSATLLLLTAGESSRMAPADKCLLPIGGRPAVLHALQSFLDSELVDHVVLVYRDAVQYGQLQEALQPSLDSSRVSIEVIQGGAQRQDSVFKALTQASGLRKYVFIHDGGRPFINRESLRALYQTVRKDRTAVLAHRVTDSIKQVTAYQTEPYRLCTLSDVDRESLWAMETPQAFATELILEAYRKVYADALRITDDAAAVSYLGYPVTLVENPFPNPKLTLAKDVDYAAFLYENRRNRKPAYLTKGDSP